MRCAIISSPMQALALREAIAVGALDPPDRILVNGPVLPIEPVLGLGAAGLRAAVVGASRREMWWLLRRADEIVLGDPFSALAQLVVVSAWSGRLVLLEDGAAAIYAWRTLADGQTMWRAHATAPSRRVLGRFATWAFRRLARCGRVTIVAGLPMSPDVAATLLDAGFDIANHDFAWSRTVELSFASLEPPARHRRVVLGSALSANGLVEPGAYRAWLRDRFADAPALFVPHPRDEPWASSLARQLGHATAGGFGLPVELRLRDFEGELRVESLPTTAALTIARIRHPRPTTMVTSPVPRSAWTAGVPRRMIELGDAIVGLSMDIDHRSDGVANLRRP